MKKGTLYLCPTPLGNLEDITLRVLRILREADKIAAEDTRQTRKLLSHYGIHTPLVSYHEHNKRQRTPQLLQWLHNGETIALVSDAGTPAIADPGEELVKKAVAEQHTVIALPGPVAAVTALSASGLPAVPFVFYGFLPPRGAQKKTILAKILAEDKTVIFYEAPHRLRRTLAALAAADGDRQVVVARELTKLHETYHRGTLAEVSSYFTQVEPQGECTVVLAPGVQAKEELGADALIAHYLDLGMPAGQAAQEVARLTGLPRNEIYRLILAQKKEGQ
ncbi:MAG: 16S rRNA (cytidine(1402)-2'-O)-methyltransferase [Firmicutes bacterium]|jgi:16S rRNA (cytidine1402-2'-O)-methyltransferase|nr:16S rRNA (cytidine(1402)-2'-O)-methyltransferase [Bacillota bacterium]